MPAPTTEIKPGDVVRLKSGGPDMTVHTVEDYLGTLSAWCEWFDGKKKMSATIAVITLEKVTPHRGSPVSVSNPK